MIDLATRLDPRRAPAAVLLLAPPVLLVLFVGLTSETTRLIFAGDLAVYRRYGLQLLAGSIPGIWIGSHLNHKLPERFIRSVLSLLLAYAGSKLIAL